MTSDEAGSDPAKSKDEKGHRGESAMHRRIECGELITLADLADRLDVDVPQLERDVEAGRLFALRTLEGMEYYPAFFAAPRLDRSVLAQASFILRELPPESRYYFFTYVSTFLGKRTALEALAEGRSEDVLTAAEGFRIR